MARKELLMERMVAPSLNTSNLSDINKKPHYKVEPALLEAEHCRRKKVKRAVPTSVRLTQLAFAMFAP
ncbi:MAG: hypothetical protein WCE82_07685 [Halobacteriota archaeon]